MCALPRRTGILTGVTGLIITTMGFTIMDMRMIITIMDMTTNMVEGANMTMITYTAPIADTTTTTIDV